MKRSNLEDQPDHLDRMLYKLPYEPEPPDLASRIGENILVHHQQHVVFRFGVSILLTIAGIWLAWPGLASMLQGLTLPDNSWTVISALIGMAEAGAAQMSAQVISSITVYQSNLSSPFSGAAWIGMIILAGGCLLALDQMLPHNEDFL